MSSDSQPTGPGYGLSVPKVVRYGLVPALVVAGLVIWLVFTFIYSVESGAGNAKKRAAEQEAQSIAAVAEKPSSVPLVPDAGQKAGITAPVSASPVFNSTDDSRTLPPMTMVVTNDDPVAQARQREQENLRRQRLQQQQQALSSALRVQLPNIRQQQPAVQTVSATGDTHETTTWRANYQQQIDRGSGAALVADNGGTNLAADAATSFTDREEKEQFLSRAQSKDWRLPYRRERGALYELKTGAVIPGIMLTGINSDLPGQILGQVSQNVYDTALGNYLLIPQGSRMIGQYDSRVSMGQQRVLIAWNRIVFPDGSSITLGAMPGADMAGYSGLEDKVDQHYLRIFGSAAIMSMISGGMAYAADSFNSSGDSSGSDNEDGSVRDSFGAALSSGLGQSTMSLLQRNSAIKPTLEVRPGYRFTMVVVRDVEFNAPYSAWR